MGRQKIEIPEGFNKITVRADMVLSDGILNKYEKEGKGKLVSRLMEQYFEDNIVELNIDDNIKNRFMNDPRKSYLISQLLTEYYMGGNLLVDTQATYNAGTVVKEDNYSTKKAINVVENTKVNKSDEFLENEESAATIIEEVDTTEVIEEVVKEESPIIPVVEEIVIKAENIKTPQSNEVEIVNRRSALSIDDSDNGSEDFTDYLLNMAGN